METLSRKFWGSYEAAINKSNPLDAKNFIDFKTLVIDEAANSISG